MVDLIDLHRAFDANMKLVSAFKELDEQAVALLR
jgi:flagellar basal body rod protein FlgC